MITDSVWDQPAASYAETNAAETEPSTYTCQWSTPGSSSRQSAAASAGRGSPRSTSRLCWLATASSWCRIANAASISPTRVALAVARYRSSAYARWR